LNKVHAVPGFDNFILSFFSADQKANNKTTSFRFQPKEVAHFVPQVPSTARANSVNDVYVDENRIAYALDRLKGGLYILELTI